MARTERGPSTSDSDSGQHLRTQISLQPNAKMKLRPSSRTNFKVSHFYGISVTFFREFFEIFFIFRYLDPNRVNLVRCNKDDYHHVSCLQKRNCLRNQNQAIVRPAINNMILIISITQSELPKQT